MCWSVTIRTDVSGEGGVWASGGPGGEDQGCMWTNGAWVSASEAEAFQSPPSRVWHKGDGLTGLAVLPPGLLSLLWGVR